MAAKSMLQDSQAARAFTEADDALEHCRPHASSLETSVGFALMQLIVVNRAISWPVAHLTSLQGSGTLYNFAQKESLLCAHLIRGHACVQFFGFQEPSQSPARHQHRLCDSAYSKRLQKYLADAIDSAEKRHLCQVSAD